jgi:hypothetical protein
MLVCAFVSACNMNGDYKQFFSIFFSKNEEGKNAAMHASHAYSRA